MKGSKTSACCHIHIFHFSENDEPHSLIVLVEEELVVIDLDSDKWPSFRLPYMNSLHSSAITCAQHISNVPEQLWSKIVDVGGAQFANLSKRVRNFVITNALILTPENEFSEKFYI